MRLHQVPTRLIAYDSPVGVGKVRAFAPSPTELYVEVGPPPGARRIAGLVPIALLFLLLSVAFGLLMFGVVFRPGAIPYAGLLLVPTVIGLGFTGMELLAGFRGWSLPSKLAVIDGAFSFPYPSPRSRNEEIAATRINRLGVIRSRTKFLRRSTSALEVGIEGGVAFVLFRGYPVETLDELTNLLGPALGLSVKEGSSD